MMKGKVFCFSASLRVIIVMTLTKPNQCFAFFCFNVFGCKWLDVMDVVVLFLSEDLNYVVIGQTVNHFGLKFS